MSFLVTLCYDLEGAESSAYERLHDDLCALGFRDSLTEDAKGSMELPSSTYLAIMEGSSARELKLLLTSRLDALFQKLDIRGRYLLSIGGGWSLKARRIR